VGKNIINFEQAEKNARKRDFKLEELQHLSDHEGVSEEEMNNAIELLSKATGKEVYIGTKKAPQSKVRFAQHLQENLGYLYKQKYLSDREKIFLADIIPYIAFSSNCIVLDIKQKPTVPANISEIAKLINSNRSNTSVVINSLKKKGILAKAESGIEGNNAKAYAIYINPHIVYAGNKENVNESLKTMFYKAMKMKILKDLPDKLF